MAHLLHELTDRMSVMLGVPVPTKAEMIMEHKRLTMIGDYERLQRSEAFYKKKKGVVRQKPQIPPTLVLKSASTDHYTPLDLETSMPASPHNHHDPASWWRVSGREPSLRQLAQQIEHIERLLSNMAHGRHSDADALGLRSADAVSHAGRGMQFPVNFTGGRPHPSSQGSQSSKKSASPSPQPRVLKSTVVDGFESLENFCSKSVHDSSDLTSSVSPPASYDQVLSSRHSASSGVEISQHRHPVRFGGGGGGGAGGGGRGRGGGGVDVSSRPSSSASGSRSAQYLLPAGVRQKSAPPRGSRNWVLPA